MVYRLAIVMPPPPFWMTKNHFRLHFSPFQINAQLKFVFKFCSENGCLRPFWMNENHFQSLFFLNHKMAAGHPKWLHFGLPKITGSHFSQFFFFTKWQYATILEVRFGPFWMPENHFRSFQINTQLLFSQNGNKQLLLFFIFV